MATTRFIHFNTYNFSENEALLFVGVVLSPKGISTPGSSGNIFECPEILAARKACNTRFVIGVT